MERDLALFPDDSIGNHLWKMLQQGDDLNQLREIEFSVIFAEHSQAIKFGQLLLENSQKLSLCAFQEDENHPWEITAYPEMSASYENISAYIKLLETNAVQFDGKFDDWYCVTPSNLPY